MKIFIYIIIGIVVLTIAAGFFLVGSPQKARIYKQDEQRIQDLQFIQSEIFNYWQHNKTIPNNLDQLNDEIRGTKMPKDPKSGENYKYIPENDAAFSLCANFEIQNINASTTIKSFVSPANKYNQPYDTQYYSNQDNWSHDKGLVCFKRIINKALYNIPKID